MFERNHYTGAEAIDCIYEIDSCQFVENDDVGLVCHTVSAEINNCEFSRNGMSPLSTYGSWGALSSGFSKISLNGCQFGRILDCGALPASDSSPKLCWLPEFRLTDIE